MIHNQEVRRWSPFGGMGDLSYISKYHKKSALSLHSTIKLVKYTIDKYHNLSIAISVKIWILYNRWIDLTYPYFSFILVTPIKWVFYHVTIKKFLKENAITFEEKQNPSVLNTNNHCDLMYTVFKFSDK